MKTRKKITKSEVLQYLKINYNQTEDKLFYQNLTPKTKYDIINRYFKQFMGYTLNKRFGLVKEWDMADNFPNYQSYKHIKTLDGLVWDMNHTVKTRQKVLNQAKLKVRQFQQKQKARRAFIKRVKAQK